MEAWVEDGDKFLKQGDTVDIKKGDLITTNKIEIFLDSENINFIIAPKGFGKTVLLIYKRLLYSFDKKTGVEFIPSDSALVDCPKSGDVRPNWNDLLIDLYKDPKNWADLWRTCITLSIIQRIKKSSIDAGHKKKEEYKKLEDIRKDKDGLICPLLRRLIYETNFKEPIDYIYHILSSFSRDDVISLLNEQEIMDQFIHNEIETPIAIFIDNVDEIFQECPEKSKQDNGSSDSWILNIEMWGKCQHGLMLAVKTMCRSNHNLSIFASIRQEAYETLDTALLENIRGYCLDDVEYSIEKLKKIFEKNIEWTDKKYLAKPEKVHAEPIISFLGFNKITENTGEEEDVFNYIYRHTLKRPRDIVFIGSQIRGLETEQRTEEVVKRTINQAATKIAKGYIKIFFPHIGFNSESKVESLFGRIHHNILRLENLKDICGEFNGGCTGKKDCKKCDKKHVFCDLYKLGLLGTVEFNIDVNKFKQRFLRPGEKTFEDNILPINEHSDIDYYLIHPILNELIGGPRETRINDTITIGDYKDWTKPRLPEFITKKKTTSLATLAVSEGFDEELPLKFLGGPFKNADLLRYYSRDKELLEAKPFKGKRVFFVLHFLRDLIPFVEAAVKLGLDLKNACFFYKDYPYPQREAIKKWLGGKGATVKPRSEIPQCLKQLDNSPLERIKDILVVEDGGFFGPTIHREFSQLIPHVKGAVEQTTRGIRNAENWEKEKEDENKLQFPIISVATSKLKSEFEPPYIAEAVVNNIKRLLPNIPLRGKRAALFGCGIIGRNIATWLRENKVQVTIFEPSHENRLWAAQNGFDVSDSPVQASKDKHFVIGASGNKSIGSKVIAGLSHGTHIVSASSELYEVDIDELTKQARQTEILFDDNREQIGTTFVLPPNDRQIHVLANGYPINFWGFESMPEKASDLILSLILLCSVELALGNYNEPGINSDAVNEIAEKYELAKKFLELS